MNLRSLQLDFETCIDLLRHLWSRIRARLFANKRASKSRGTSAKAQPKGAVGARVAPGRLSLEQQILWSDDPRIWRRWR